MRNVKTFLANLPHHPGVYQMLDEKGQVLYVGKAKNLKNRLSSYFSGRLKDIKTVSLVKQISDIDITVTTTENEAVLLESNLIKKYRPRYNVLLRDDKSYPYILITSLHDFPRIDLYRGPRKKNGLYFGPYPSAYAVRETISLLQKIFRLRTCQDSFFSTRTRPCLLHQIGRCTGPCVGLISKHDYADSVRLAILFLEGKNEDVVKTLQHQMEAASTQLDYEKAAAYRDQIARLRQIQERQYVNVDEGNADIVGFAMQSGIACLQLLSIRDGQVLGSRSYFPTVPPHSTHEEIVTAFLTQHYLHQPAAIESIPKQIIVDTDIPDCRWIENALADAAQHKVDIIYPQRGEKKKWLDMAMASTRDSLAAQVFTKINMHERIHQLQKALALAHTPRRVECFDISHHMGEATVASCVVFDQNGPVKSDYRRFNIKGITPGDDPSAMHQALLRRFKRLQQEEAILPDVVFIDGGKTQLNAAQDALSSLNVPSVLLVGVSKGPDRKAGFETLHIEGRPPMHLPSDSLALLFIQQIRDESHRFAITGHRQRLDQTRRHSTLELIPGIGVKRRRELLRYFGGIQGLAHASLEELKKVPGISNSLAERIFAALHDATI